MLNLKNKKNKTTIRMFLSCYCNSVPWFPGNFILGMKANLNFFFPLCFPSAKDGVFGAADRGAVQAVNCFFIRFFSGGGPPKGRYFHFNPLSSGGGEDALKTSLSSGLVKGKKRAGAEVKKQKLKCLSLIWWSFNHSPSWSLLINGLKESSFTLRLPIIFSLLFPLFFVLN